MKIDKPAKPGDPATKISTLWIVVMFTMAFADILTFITPGTLKDLATGYAGDMQITPAILLVFAILTEIPIAMIFLSRILPRTANRVVNIVAGVITIAYVVGGGSATLHYIFFAAIEIIAIILIGTYAWRWPKHTGENQ